MEIRNFQYINREAIDSDFSQITGSLITEISTTRGREIESGVKAGGEFSVGAIFALVGMRFTGSGSLSKKKIDDEEVKAELSAENKLAFVEAYMRYQGKLNVIRLDETKENDIVLPFQANPNRFYELTATFLKTFDQRNGRNFFVFSKPMGSQIVLIPCSPEHVRTTRGFDYEVHSSCTAICYYGGTVADPAYSPQSVTTHVFFPRAVWDS